MDETTIPQATGDTESRRDDPLQPPAPARPGPHDPFALIDHGEAALNDDQLQGITAGLCLFRCMAR